MRATLAFFMLTELRLTRAEHNLCDVQQMLRGKRIIWVRYTQTELVALYIA